MQLAQWFDIIVVVAILILGIKGAINGIIREIFGLIGLIGGLVVSSRFSKLASEFIQQNIYKFENLSMLDFVGFVSLWLVFWLLCLLIGRFLSRLVGISGLGFLDRLGGFIAGSGKIFLTLAAVLAVISTTSLNEKVQPYFKDSMVYPVLLDTGKWIANMDVKAIKDDMQEMIKKPAENIMKNEEILKQIYN